MNKRIWVILLALALCVAALCVGVSAEESSGDETCAQGCIAHGMQSGYTYIWHIKTLTDLTDTITYWTDINYYPAPVITFFSDVNLEQTLTIRNCSTTVTLDLNGHKIFGAVETSPVVEVNFSYGGSGSGDTFIRHCIAIQNGTIENTAEGGTALKLSYGATTLENVTVKGSTVLTARLVDSKNYTPHLPRRRKL